MQSCYAHTILFAAKVLLGEPGLNFLLILLYIYVHFIHFGSTCLAVFSRTRRTLKWIPQLCYSFPGKVLFTL